MIASSKNIKRVVVIFVFIWQTICLGQITTSLPYCSPTTLESGTTNQVVLAFTATNNTNETIENVHGDIVLSKDTYIDDSDETLWGPYTYIHDTLGPYESFRYGWPAYGGTWPLDIPDVIAGQYYIIFRVYPGGDTCYTLVEISQTELVLQASEPSPANGAQLFDTWANLSWKSVDTAVLHHVYIGTSLYDMAPVSSQTETSFLVGLPGFTYPNGLVPGTTYYWYIDEVFDDGSVVEGDIWSFTVERYLTILDKEQTLDYDNSTYPYITELVMDTPGDLTDGGILSELLIRFKGDPGNSAEPIYVKLEDSTGAVYTVAYPDPAAAQIADWIDWRIPLYQFVGVDPKKAVLLSVVTGKEGEPGGSGVITYACVKAVPEAGSRPREGLIVQVVTVQNGQKIPIPFADVKMIQQNSGNAPPDKLSDTTADPSGSCQLRPIIGETYCITVTVPAGGYKTKVDFIECIKNMPAKVVVLDPDDNVYPVKLVADDGNDGDWLGRRVSISGEYAITGVLHGDNDCGSAYIFENGDAGWKKKIKLTALLPTAGEQFGCDVSISGDNAIVGAENNSYNGPSSGAAYIFQRTNAGWIQQEMLVPLDGGIGHHFGYAVSISGNYAIIGSYSGSAYIFNLEGQSWEQQEKLTPSSPAIGNQFGSAVSISGDYAIVGAPLDNSNGTASGSAYIFKLSGSNWIQQGNKLVAEDGQTGDEFGGSVCLKGDYAIVGAIGNDDKGEDSGAAYIFKNNDNVWSQQYKLVPEDGAGGDHFGNSVSIDGDYAVVGAHLDADEGTESGSVYIFKQEGQDWEQQAKLTAPLGNPYDHFGQGVSIDGSYVIVGAPWNDVNGDNAGCVHIFKRVGTKWTP